MYRARYLALIVFGEGHPDMATFDVRITIECYVSRSNQRFKLSIRACLYDPTYPDSMKSKMILRY